MGYVWVEREGRDVVTHAAPKEDGVGQSHNLTQTHIEKKKNCHLVYTLPNGTCFLTDCRLGLVKVKRQKQEKKRKNKNNKRTVDI